MKRTRADVVTALYRAGLSGFITVQAEPKFTSNEALAAALSIVANLLRIIRANSEPNDEAEEEITKHLLGMMVLPQKKQS